jgi:molybdate transport system permease protein
VGLIALVIIVGLPLAALASAVFQVPALARLQEPTLLASIRLSLLTSAVATGMAVALGLPAAYFLARSRFWGKAVVEALLDLPMTLPPVVAGVALLLALGRNGLLGAQFEAMGIRLPFTTAAVVIAQTFMSVPFFVRSARAGFASVPDSLEHAAFSLGLTPLQAFRRVSVPLAAPALWAGAVLAWARALSEFGATLVFAGNREGVTQTLPLAIVTSMEQDLDSALAVAFVSLVLAAVALLGMRVVVRKFGPPGEGT